MGEKAKAENTREVPAEAAPKTQTCANEMKDEDWQQNNTKPHREILLKITIKYLVLLI